MLQRYKKLWAALLLGVALLVTVQKASAFWDQYGTYATIVSSAAAGTAGLLPAASAAVGTTAPAAGLGPIGWAAIGVAVVAVVAVTYYAGVHRRIVVSTKSNADDPNPDVPVTDYTPGPSGVIPNFGGASYNYLYVVTPSNLAQSDAYRISEEARFIPRLQEQLNGLGYGHIKICGAGATCPQKLSYFANTGNTNCPSNSCLYAYYETSTTVLPVGARTSSSCSGSPAVCTYVFWMPAVTGTGTECPANSKYDGGLRACITQPLDANYANDGICRVSWGPAGNPLKNPFDPDCAGLVVDSGTATTPPYVKVVDPESGKEVRVERPVNSGQGSPGSVRVKERTPNPSTNTTTEQVSDIRPQADPAAPPVTAGSTQVTYGGTGESTSPTPLTSVSVSNWPNTLNVNCTNCTPAAQPFPETMKIDSEGKSESDLPDGEAMAQEFAGMDFMAGIKEKLNPFSQQIVPSHTGECPTVHVKFNAWNLNIDHRSTAVCDFLETPELKQGLQVIVKLMITLGAILIVLGA